MIDRPSLSFDDYADAIQGAHVLYLKAGPTAARWDHAWYQLNRTALQFGADGSARIAHGITPSDTTLFMIQSKKISGEVFLDGDMAKWHDMAVFPPACHFTFVCNVPAQWVSLSLPSELANDLRVQFAENPSASVQTHKAMITLSHASARRFVKAAQDAKRSIQNSARPERQIGLHSIETFLLRTLNDAISDRIDEKILPDKRIESSEKIIFKALTYVESKISEQIQMDELVDETGVTYRTLLRAFQKYLRIGPKRYLKLRQLNIVRRVLRQKHLSSASVIGILSEHGVTEFGRFATEYKTLFHESPSETFRKSNTMTR